MNGVVTDADYAAILAFRDRLRRFLYWSEEQAKVEGLTPAQHQLLLSVRGHQGADPPAIGDIAAHLQVRHHSAVGLVDRAVRAGLVERVPDRHDRRVVRVRLLEAGCAVLDNLTTSHLAELAVLAEAFADLRIPPSPASDADAGRPAP